MKIIIAPDSFKGSLSAIEVADIIGKEIKKVLPKVRIEKFPLHQERMEIKDYLM